MKHLPRLLVLAVLTIGVAITVWYPLSLDDHWWHMLTGRYVLEHHSVPTTEPFSYSMAGAPWVNWEWPAGVVMYSVYEWFGPGGLVALRFVALMATLAITWWHLDLLSPKRSALADLPLRLILLALLLMTMFGRVADRPHVYALPFVAGAYCLATHAARSPKRRWVIAQLALMVPWALFHPSWVLGVMVHTAVLADAWLDARSEKRPLEGGWFYLLSPLFLVIPALVFHPIKPYLDAVTDYFSAMNTSSVKVSPREWLPLWDFLDASNTPLVMCVVLMGARLGALALDRQTLRRPSTWLGILLLAAAVWFVRFTPEFAVLAVPPTFLAFSKRLQNAKTPARTVNLATGLLAALTMLLIVVTKDIYLRPYAIGIDARQNPVQVGDFMERHSLGGNVFSSDLNADAYLAFRRYPDVREFIDGRIPQAFPESLFLEYREVLVAPDRFDALLTDKPVEHVVLQGLFTEGTTADCFVLARRGDFELVHIDADWLLWTKKSVLDALADRPPAYHLVIPPLIDDTWFVHALQPKTFPRALEELTRLVREEPGMVIGVTLVETLDHHPNATDDQRKALEALLSAP